MSHDHDPLAPLKQCELHVHMGGCFSVDDILELGAPHFRDVDWSLFVDAFDAAYGVRPDPLSWFEMTAAGDARGREAIARHFVFTEEDGPDFGRFQAKFNLLISVARHYIRNVDDGEREIPQRALARHRSGGVRYVEMRSNYRDHNDVEMTNHFHRLNVDAVRRASDAAFTARYVPSLDRSNPLLSYQRARAVLDADSAYDVVLGVDFCDIEEGFPPRLTKPFFEQLERDNDADPDRSLQVLYHVGEIYFDKSIESAVRWCHEAAELGARRLGHCTALGLDPEVAVARRGGSHAREKTSERIDQIDYDLRHRKGLEDAGVDVDVDRLKAERERLGSHDPDRLVHRAYDEQRLEQARRRQTYALDQITRLGAVIESCPSSNLRLGSVPSADHHPVHRFLASDVSLAIGADDPGIFDSPLHAEVDWVARTTHMTPQALFDRLGDPYRFRLHRQRA